MAVIATVGAANANSFQTVAEVDAYFVNRVPVASREEWTDADSEDKDAAVIMATIQMTALICWASYPTNLTQALPFPRTSLLAKNELEYVPNDVIPQEIKNAHAEFSRYLLLDERLDDSDVIKLGLQKVKAGPIDIQFLQKYPVTHQPPVIPYSIINMIPSSWIEYVEDQRNNIMLQRY